jgi:AraC-like DNA-binding protein
MRGTATVVCELVQKVLALAMAMGMPAHDIAESAGISVAELAERDRRVPLDKLLEVFDEIERRAGDPAFGLRVAEASRARPDNALALALASSPTLGEAFRRVARYTRIINDAAAIELATAGDVVRVQYRLDRAGEPHRAGAQMALAMLCLLGRESLGARFRVAHVAFRHPAPHTAVLAEYARIFEAPVAFGAHIDELVVPPAVLAEPLPRADPALCAHLDRHLDELLDRMQPAALRAQVSRLLGRQLSGGAPDIEWVAAQLHMSPRSLQRRLRDAGTSFQELLDSLRRDLALRYLAQGLAVAEVAFLIGFTEASNFHRAFKRWTGMTPAEARGRAFGRVASG